jgi:hypothetical protein
MGPLILRARAARGCPIKDIEDVEDASDGGREKT